MSAVVEWIDVDASRGEVETAWKHFSEWVLVGRGRLICTQLACLNAQALRKVRFEDLAEERTRVVFEIAHEEVSGPAGSCMEEQDHAAIAGRLEHDLRVFKDLVEAGERPGRDWDPRRRPISGELADADSDHRGQTRPARPFLRS